MSCLIYFCCHFLNYYYQNNLILKYSYCQFLVLVLGSFLEISLFLLLIVFSIILLLDICTKFSDGLYQNLVRGIPFILSLFFILFSFIRSFGVISCGRLKDYDFILVWIFTLFLFLIHVSDSVYWFLNHSLLSLGT